MPLCPQCKVLAQSQPGLWAYNCAARDESPGSVHVDPVACEAQVAQVAARMHAAASAPVERHQWELLLTPRALRVRQQCVPHPHWGWDVRERRLSLNIHVEHVMTL